MNIQGPCLKHCYNFNLVLIAFLLFVIAMLVIYLFILKNKLYKETERI